MPLFAIKGVHGSVKWALLVVFAVTFIRFAGLGKWQKENVIKSDGLAYYSYLPAAFIYGDLSFVFYKSLPDAERGKYWVYPHPEGKALPKMTIGVAMLQMPFFLVAYLSSLINGDLGTGHEWPYQLAIGISAIAALLIGMLALARVLSLWFSNTVTILTLLVIGFATNLYYYAVFEGAMSHVYSFALIALLLERYIAFQKERGSKSAAVLGLLAGFIVLVRPTNCVLLVVPLLLELNEGGLRVLPRNWKAYIIALVFFAVPLVLQMTLWKYVTGSWVYYTYEEEGFYFDRPEILKGLFSYRNGWFVYTPVMLLVVPGLVFFYRIYKHMALAIVLLLVILVYITFSWWVWFYGDSFGARPMVDFYAVFALPLAAFFSWSMQGRVKGILTITLCVGLVVLNLSQARLYDLHVIDGSSMTKEAYWASFGRCEIPKSWWERGLLDPPDFESLRKGLPERDRDTLAMKWIGELGPSSAIIITNLASPALGKTFFPCRLNSLARLFSQPLVYTLSTCDLRKVEKEVSNRNIVHMDLDSFFVSVERLHNKKLEGRPVLVGGSTNRGVVASCSYEARTYGIHSAMPMRMALQLCPHAVVVKGDSEQYSRFSNMVTEIIRENVPLFEKTSIDEFYMDLTGMDRFFGCYKLASELRQRVIKETKLPISFGLSANKTVSKIATGEAKPNNQLQVNYGTEKPFLAPLSVTKIPMIGESTAQLLRRMGVLKIQTLQQMPVEVMDRAMGKNGILIWKKANGIDNSPVEPYEERKSISTERTFEKDTTDVHHLRSLIISMVESLAFQMRSESKLTACVTVKIRYSDFNTYTMQKRIPYTASDQQLISIATELFNKLYSKRMLVRLVGVRFSHLVGGGHQINMFEDSVETIRLYQAMDHIRKKYGGHAVKRAVGMHNTRIGRGHNPFRPGPVAPLPKKPEK